MNRLKEIGQLKTDYQQWLKSRPHSRSAFPDGLRADILSYVEAGRGAEVCRVLGLPGSTVSNWRTRKKQISVIKIGEKTKPTAAVQEISYSKIDLSGAPVLRQQAVLAEIAFSTSGRQISIRFHDQSCLERALPVLFRCGERQ